MEDKEIEKRKKRFVKDGIVYNENGIEVEEEEQEIVNSVQPVARKRKVGGTGLGGKPVPVNKLKGVKDKGALTNMQKEMDIDKSGIRRWETRQNAEDVLFIVKNNLRLHGLYDTLNPQIYNMAVVTYEKMFKEGMTKRMKLDNLALEVYNVVMKKIGKPEVEHLDGAVTTTELQRWYKRKKYAVEHNQPIPPKPESYGDEDEKN